MQKVFLLPPGARLIVKGTHSSTRVLTHGEIKQAVGKYNSMPHACIDRSFISFSPFIIHRTIRIKIGLYDFNVEMRLSDSCKEVSLDITVSEEIFSEFGGVPVRHICGKQELFHALDEFGPQMTSEKLFKLLPEELFFLMSKISHDFRMFFSGFFMLSRTTTN